MSNIAIKVEGLGKEYIIGHQKNGDLRYSLQDKVNQLFNRKALRESFWALKDISFEIKKGEAVGIIGRNGAGKSTLLKILSRITEPTRGRFEINGRVSSLLEVGTGFHMELTGRENIYLNGTILGMKRREIKSKFDEIVAFSGVEKFIDTPVKHYSSGMNVRLAFSVAAHLEPEILIVDEVLAVGDSEFQKKCLGKMDEVSKKEGRTVLFVSHNMASVQNLCQTGIFLENSHPIFTGGIHECVDKYLQRNTGKALTDSKLKNNFLSEVTILDRKDNPIDMLYSGQEVRFKFCFNKKFEALNNVLMILQFTDYQGNILFTCNNFHTIGPFKLLQNTNTIYCHISKLPLNKGKYYINLMMLSDGKTLCDYPNIMEIKVEKGDFFGTGKLPRPKFGLLVENNWTKL